MVSIAVEALNANNTAVYVMPHHSIIGQLGGRTTVNLRRRMRIAIVSSREGLCIPPFFAEPFVLVREGGGFGFFGDEGELFFDLLFLFFVRIDGVQKL